MAFYARLSNYLAMATFFAATLFSTDAARAVVINFDDLGNGEVVGSHYAEATFTSTLGRVILTTAQSPPYTTSSPNFICTGFGSIDCVGDVRVAFTNPVNGLTFLSTGADNVGAAQAKVDVYENGVLAGTVNIPGIGAVHTSQPIDLSGFHNVTLIVIRDVIDPAGLGYDDFSFTVVAGAVPELSTWAMMLIGFAGVGFAAYRRKKKVSAAVAVA